MLVRPPSLQKTYDNFYWRDPAFIQPPDEPAKDADDDARAAYKKAAEAHLERFKVARETGRWEAVTVEGRQPTKFVMRPLPGTIARKIADWVRAGTIGDAQARSLAFRAAVQSADEFADKLAHAEYDGLGKIATETIVDVLDAITPAIVNDLGADVLARSRGPSPK